MSIATATAFSQRSFLADVLPTTAHKPNTGRINLKNTIPVSCHSNSDHIPKNSSRKENEQQLAKLAIVTLAAGVLTLSSVDPASAAKTGGRVGGQAFRSSASPRSSGPRINNSRTNIYINPRVAPPLVGGYGYGLPFYGGWGWSPFSFFAPGPSVAVVGGGFDFFTFFIFLGAATVVIRRFFRSREEEEDDVF
ncbi:uncharacterized protein LOC130772313 [Actinidia eriantha]|uniref:uncharacterized protein LOC130772313 n=1 Tax=Actinidia eriantha TaxID=165200 RepID=UPI00258676A9|nr:uncharacterized protein LOC130772313 [Actinidia eriantha]